MRIRKLLITLWLVPVVFLIFGVFNFISESGQSSRKLDSKQSSYSRLQKISKTEIVDLQRLVLFSFFFPFSPQML